MLCQRSSSGTLKTHLPQGAHDLTSFAAYKVDTECRWVAPKNAVRPPYQWYRFSGSPVLNEISSCPMGANSFRQRAKPQAPHHNQRAWQTLATSFTFEGSYTWSSGLISAYSRRLHVPDALKVLILTAPIDSETSPGSLAWSQACRATSHLVYYTV